MVVPTAPHGGSQVHQHRHHSALFLILVGYRQFQKPPRTPRPQRRMKPVTGCLLSRLKVTRWTRMKALS